MSDMTKASPEDLAVFHILELAEQGRPHEVAAQFAASWLMSSDLDQDEIRGFHMDLMKIRHRMEYLALHPEEIWDGLLPGGPGVGPRFGTVFLEEWDKYNESDRILKNVKDAYVANYVTEPYNEALDNEARLSAIGRALKGEDPEKVNPYSYTISIMCDPRVNFGPGQQRTLMHPKNFEAQTPLEFAAQVILWMTVLLSSSGIPVSEQVAWITHDESGAHWIMDFAQAEVISLLEETRRRLVAVDPDYDTEFIDNEFQGIADQMALYGTEWGREQGPNHDNHTIKST